MPPQPLVQNHYRSAYILIQCEKHACMTDIRIKRERYMATCKTTLQQLWSTVRRVSICDTLS